MERHMGGGEKWEWAKWMLMVLCYGFCIVQNDGIRKIRLFSLCENGKRKCLCEIAMRV
jgi:hypothetical protein